VFWIRIQEGKNDPQKKKKLRIYGFTHKPGGSLLGAEGFCCNLNVHFGGLGIGKVLFLIEKKKHFQL
jgi:hypothetical protein